MCSKQSVVRRVASHRFRFRGTFRFGFSETLPTFASHGLVLEHRTVRALDISGKQKNVLVRVVELEMRCLLRFFYRSCISCGCIQKLQFIHI